MIAILGLGAPRNQMFGARMSDFDPSSVTPQDLKKQPISVIKTELPALAEALGVKPEELFRSLIGPDVAVDALRPTSDQVAMCCNNDSW
jgi:hypothetical protein